MRIDYRLWYKRKINMLTSKTKIKTYPSNSIKKEIIRVGSVLFERSERAKHINISIKPFRGVRVAVPYGVSFEKAERVVHSKINWIERNLSKITKAEQEYDSVFRQSALINRREARREITDRLNELAASDGFFNNKVFIRNQRTRWGSCSSKNNINLNLKLVILPDEMMDYVIVHELLHTV